MCNVYAEESLKLKMKTNKDNQTEKENQKLPILNNGKKHKINVGQKSPVTLLNELKFQDESGKTKRIAVSYILMDITGLSHRPIYTYMCQINNKTAMGKGYSKKEAKQNSAAHMYKILFEIDSIANIDKVITSTTNTDNFEVNENRTDNLTNIDVTQIIDETDSMKMGMGDKKLLYSEVQILHCDMNPVGSLKELCTKYKLAPPLYTFYKRISEKLNSHKSGGRLNIISHEVICQLYNLQSTGISSKKQKAKQLAAKRMVKKLSAIGTDKFNELKSLNRKKIPSNENGEKNECIQDPELSAEWQPAYIFKLHVASKIVSKIATSPVNNTEVSTPHSSNVLNLVPQNEEFKFNEDAYHTEFTEPEHLIMNCNPDSNAVEKLQTLCQQLGYEPVYMCVNSCLTSHAQEGQSQKTYSILLQVSSIPITVTIGYGSTIEIATQSAAKHAVYAFQTMLDIASLPEC